MNSAAARAARSARFAAEASAGVPAAPERRFAHADFSRNKVIRTDPEEKLAGLCKRKLAAGEELNDAQRVALARMGVSVAELHEEAARDAARVAVAPAVYAESRLRSPSRVREQPGQQHPAAAAPPGQYGSSSSGKRARSDSLRQLSAPARNRVEQHSRVVEQHAAAAPRAAAPQQAAPKRPESAMLLRLRKRLKRIDEALSVKPAHEHSEAWQRRLANRPDIVAQIAALEGEGAAAGGGGAQPLAAADSE